MENCKNLEECFEKNTEKLNNLRLSLPDIKQQFNLSHLKPFFLRKKNIKYVALEISEKDKLILNIMVNNFVSEDYTTYNDHITLIYNPKEDIALPEEFSKHTINISKLVIRKKDNASVFYVSNIGDYSDKEKHFHITSKIPKNCKPFETAGFVMLEDETVKIIPISLSFECVVIYKC